MTIHEPMTAATDLALTLAAAVFATLLWRRGRRLWSYAFLFTAAGSLFGGVFHGSGTQLWWKPTVLSIGIASFFLLLAGTRSRVIHGIALVKFVAYASWMITHDDFLWVIVDYGVSMLVLLVVHCIEWCRDDAPGSSSIVASVVVSVIAAAVQQAPFAWHNDVYHLVQLVALWLLYRGAAASPLGSLEAHHRGREIHREQRGSPQ